MKKTTLNITRKVNKEKKKMLLISNPLRKTRDNKFKLIERNVSKTKSIKPINN